MTNEKITAPRHITKDAIYAELLALKAEKRETDEMTVFSTRIRKSTKQELKKISASTGRSVQDITDEAFRMYFDSLDSE